MFDIANPNYSNTPNSSSRPRSAPRIEDLSCPPAVSVVTPFFSGSKLIFDTARSLMAQSLQQFEWIIVNDATENAESLTILDTFRRRDPRIKVIDHDENSGPGAARNTGVGAAQSDYIFFLDDDDLLEPTTLEKTYWFLIGHPDCAFVNGWSVGFGAEEYTWCKGYERGHEFLNENLVTGRTMVRRSIFQEIGGYDPTLRAGFEDWDLWLRFADEGFWGATIPEVLDWYRRREDHSDRWALFSTRGDRESFRKGLQKRYPRLYRERAIPEIKDIWHEPFEAVPTEIHHQNEIQKNQRRALLILPWMTMGGSDKFALDVVEGLVQKGWDLTIVTTVPDPNSWASVFGRHTSDVHILDRFLRLVDYPRYIAYLMHSRRPDVVFMSHSELGYFLLPFLREQYPPAVYVDYCHIEEEEWKQGGYPRHATSMQALLDRNLVSSSHLKNWMVAKGADPEKIDVIHTNIDIGKWKPLAGSRTRLRKEWRVSSDETVILFAGRICPQKQPRVLAETFRSLVARGVAFRAIIAGDGEYREWLESFFAEKGFADRILFLGSVEIDRMCDIMSASDIFFLPSLWEGIALSLFEAMAMELAVVGSDVGGQKELVAPGCGILIQPGDEKSEVEQYSDALEQVLRDSAIRNGLGSRARKRIAEKFQIYQMLDSLEASFLSAIEELPEEPLPVASGSGKAWAELAVEYTRISSVADNLWRSPAPGENRPTQSREVGRELLREVRAREELYRLESSRSWRAARRLRSRSVFRLYARLRNSGDPSENREDQGVNERLASIKNSFSFRLIRFLKRTPFYSVWARLHWGRDWRRDVF